MISGYDRVRTKRSWWVPGFTVWGLPSWEEAEFLAVEDVEGTASVHFGVVAIGDASQPVLYSELIDHRGNQLPSSLDKPLVLIRPRSEATVFVVEQESATGFRIARESTAIEPATVDLLVIEMGA